MTAANGLWSWEVGARRPPEPVTLPPALTQGGARAGGARGGGLARVVADGGYWWVTRHDGLSYPVDLSRAPAHPAPLAGEPLRMPPPPERLALPVGGHLAELTREGVTLSWGGARHLVPPTYDLALLAPHLIALATARGVEVWEARGGSLRRALSLDLGAPVTRLVASRAALYLMCPTRGLYWARVTPSPTR